MTEEAKDAHVGEAQLPAVGAVNFNRWRLTSDPVEKYTFLARGERCRMNIRIWLRGSHLSTCVQR